MPNPFVAIRDGVQLRVGQELRVAKKPEEFRSTLQRVYGMADDLGAKVLAASSKSLACCAGCSYCCYFKVDVHAHEVFVIVDYIRRHFSDDEIATVQRRAAENVRRLEPMTVEQQLGTNIECSLLKDGKCSVYPARPFGCRRHHAQDVAPCKYAFDHPERINDPLARDTKIMELAGIFGMSQEGVDAAFEKAGYDPNVYDLNAALVEALASPKPERRWRDKKRAFSSAALSKDNAITRQMVGVMRGGLQENNLPAAFGLN